MVIVGVEVARWHDVIDGGIVMRGGATLMLALSYVVWL